ncbi:MAG TPA: WYL domain-containing protein [Massilibacterium sp.]|nr:WYL domain-containing protein [Massilibacterium sp.]
MIDDLSKSMRILSMFDRLSKGEILSKVEEANRFGVVEKTIQRDIADLRTYISETYGHAMRIEYNRKKQGYILKKDKSLWFQNEEILSISKVLIESRAFNKEEMNQLIGKLLNQCEPDSKKLIKDTINNELFHYSELMHKKKIMSTLWELSNAVRTKTKVRIHYKPNAQYTVKRTIRPMGVIFSEFYFYLVAYNDKKAEPDLIPYRIDRIETYKILNERFRVNYNERFEEGRFRKQVQFMYAGELLKIELKCHYLALEAVLDRLPTARVVENQQNFAIVEAEVYGEGVVMWLLSQAHRVEVLKPASLRMMMKEKIYKMNKLYE